jgi:hypothetical protein
MAEGWDHDLGSASRSNGAGAAEIQWKKRPACAAATELGNCT